MMMERSPKYIVKRKECVTVYMCIFVKKEGNKNLQFDLTFKNIVRTHRKLINKVTQRAGNERLIVVNRDTYGGNTSLCMSLYSDYFKLHVL